MRRIINHFTDNDLYTFTCQYYILEKYPDASVRYSFFDRNSTRYPKGFDKLLVEQINMMADLQITDEEVEFMQSRIRFLPTWYYTFLKGLRFNPSEVHVFQDSSGYLSITIEGKWYSAILWDVTLLSIISELMHEIQGDMPKVDLVYEYKKAYEKGIKAFSNGIVMSDMGTRRRFSFEVHSEVVRGLRDAYNKLSNDVDNGAEIELGKLVGTSNVWFAKEFGLTPIGTMSHQICSFEECVSGVYECNHQLMRKWSDVYDGDLGIFLPDTFTTNMFYANLSKKMAKLYDGLRIDSGDEYEETNKFIEKYSSLGVNPKEKAVVYSNALTIDKAIEIHRWVNGRVRDSYGIGTFLCADVTNQETKETFAHSNIVIKLIAMKITRWRQWCDCVKLSNSLTKMIGDNTKCQYLASLVRSIGNV